MSAVWQSEIQRLDDELQRGYEGEPWHGPALQAVLHGVSAEMAAQHLVPGGHSIWEIVVHLAAWDKVVVQRITQREPIEEPVGGNFPPVTNTSSEAWAALLGELDQNHRHLRQVILSLKEAQLHETVAGKSYSVVLMLHGVAQHLAYHTGQIALLKKLVGP
jgi:uncharacterized damage-inducible protein DinB